MTDALSIGWTAGQAATQRTVYRRVLGFALIVQTVLALIAIVAPIWLARAAELPGAPSAGWVRLWGAHVADHGGPVSAGLDRTGLFTCAERDRDPRAFRLGGCVFWPWPRPAVVRTYMNW